MKRGTESRWQRLRNQFVVWLGLVVVVGLPSYWFAVKLLAMLGWELSSVVYVALVGVITLVVSIALASALVSALLGFMGALKR